MPEVLPADKRQRSVVISFPSWATGISILLRQQSEGRAVTFLFPLEPCFQTVWAGLFSLRRTVLLLLEVKFIVKISEEICKTRISILLPASLRQNGTANPHGDMKMEIHGLGLWRSFRPQGGSKMGCFIFYLCMHLLMWSCLSPFCSVGPLVSSTHSSLNLIASGDHSPLLMGSLRVRFSPLNCWLW